MSDCLSFFLVPSWSSSTPLCRPQSVVSHGACPNSLLFHYFHFILTFESIKGFGSMSLGLFFRLFYSWHIPQKVLEKNFKNHDNFFNRILIRFALNNCQNMSFPKKIQIIKHVFLLFKNICYNVFK